MFVITQGFLGPTVITQGYGLSPAPVAPPPGPGAAQYVFESPKKKKRRKFEEALLIADFDFLKAEEYVKGS